MTGYQIEYQKQTSFFFREVPGDNYTLKLPTPTWCAEP